MTMATSNRLAIRQHQQGFTLLEVMVALAILAVVAISASQASRSYVQSVDNMKTRTFGYYVAQNTLAELRLQKTWHPIRGKSPRKAVNGKWLSHRKPYKPVKALSNLFIFASRLLLMAAQKKTWWILMRCW